MSRGRGSALIKSKVSEVELAVVAPKVNSDLHRPCVFGRSSRDGSVVVKHSGAEVTPEYN